MTRTISNSDDVIDSRDVIERITELQDKREELAEAVAESQAAHDACQDGAPDMDEDTAGKLDERTAALAEWDEDNGQELKDLLALASEAEGCAADWTHGETLIRESYFVEYCQELCKDIGDLPKNLPSYIEIDWEETARNIRQDYTEVEYGDVTYLIR